MPRVKVINNHDFYCSIVKGRSVLHVGCAGHKEMVDIRMHNNTFLHKKLMPYAKITHGVDINKEAIEYLKEKYNINNIFYSDITQGDQPVELLKFYDIILVPEVVEHVLDVGIFLKSIKKFMSAQSVLLISVPNSFKIHNTLTTLRGYEEVNPDHKYCFSYSTLKGLMETAGFTVDRWYVTLYGNKINGLFKRLFIKINPWFADGIIVQCRTNTEQFVK